MSSRNSRIGILDAALDLMTQRGAAGLSMAEIAKAAHVSRQGIYFHFADRADLMLAVVRHVDEKRHLEEEIQAVMDAPDAITSLRMAVSLQARTNPAIWAVAQAFDAVRRTDEAAERGWQDRLQHRMAGCHQSVARLKSEGKLKEGLDPSVAADLLWTITSLRAWEDLVLQRGWSAEQYEKHVFELLLAALTNCEPG